MSTSSTGTTADLYPVRAALVCSEAHSSEISWFDRAHSLYFPIFTALSTIKGGIVKCLIFKVHFTS